MIKTKVEQIIAILFTKHTMVSETTLRAPFKSV